MENVPDTPLGAMYREHIHHIKQKDIESLLDQYAEDALLISSIEKEPKYYEGRDEVREHLQGIMDIEDLETEVSFWAETEDPTTLMVTEKITMITGEGEEVDMRFADSWVLRDGKIAIHFAGMVQYPDGSLA